MNRDDRIRGVLLGTAIGDALGLPAEGLSPERIVRRFGCLDRYRLFGRTGFVSDDTEQTALVAHAWIEAHDGAAEFARAFARRLRAWFLALPLGIGLATAKACLRLCLGVSSARSGSDSAGNGAAMRAALVGVLLCDEPSKRLEFSQALARVTHRDPRAVEGAAFVAELAAQGTLGSPSQNFDLAAARSVVRNEELIAAIDKAGRLAECAEPAQAAHELGTSGFVVHTLGFASYCVARFGADPARALVVAVNAGGDTDSIGAIVGALVGARHGASALPAALLGELEDGPLGRSHLTRLADALGKGGRAPPRFRPILLLVRNLLLLPVILGHGFWRLLP